MFSTFSNCLVNIVYLCVKLLKLSNLVMNLIQFSFSKNPVSFPKYIIYLLVNYLTMEESIENWGLKLGVFKTENTI